MSKRKSWVHSSNSNRAGNWWLPFLQRVHYLKQCWVPAFPVSFFAQLLEGICAGSSPGLGKEPTRKLCSLPLESLEQTSPESAMATGTGPFGENSHGKSISWPLGRETRPFSNPKAKTAWVCPKLFNKEKARENLRAKVYCLSPLTTHLKTCCHLFRTQMKALLSQSPSFELKCCWCSSSHDQLFNVLSISGIAYMVATLQLLFVCRIRIRHLGTVYLLFSRDNKPLQTIFRESILYIWLLFPLSFNFKVSFRAEQVASIIGYFALYITFV